ncbi:YadA-like family protein [Morganella morganii]|uniref:beta strand repeat-containing protein n=1 Tax=Morganella morganii TaxID=582 RepID=UPI0015E6913E|nr:YadA-like family protein [Morganella morganii]QXO45843.1 YadA-like family protein [Morganella morganii]QXO49512.1 YadA-like family protein [Morganella morganii]QXO53373.1 YadA-like family protein [Morganella morganii]QXO57248.1 YadA-like family protein [Morganella morganii]QXO61080.1 YadA-like family protein [Morganella morganii]
MAIGFQAKLASSPTDTAKDTVGGSMVIGTKAEVYGFGSTGIGSGTYAKDGSTALGATAIANNFSTSIGRFAVAENNGVALGKNAISTTAAKGGVAIGNDSKVTAERAIALGDGSQATTANEVSFGNELLKRKLTNISAGSSDNDAVNFKQLSATNEIVAKNTGDIAGHTTAITTINNSLTEGTLGLVQLSADGKKIVLSDKVKDATVFEFGGKKLSGISNAALAADSTEAVNGSQLFATNEQVKANTDGITQHTADIAKNTTDIAGNKADITKNTADIAGNKTAITQNTTDITKNTSDIAGNTAAINQNTTDITGNKTAITQNTTNITKNTSDIAGNKADITKNTTDIAKNTGDITTINNNLAAGTLGLVQLSADGKKIVLSDKVKDATVFEFGGKKLSGVSNAALAADSTEAVNGSQLFATNEQVKANTDGISQNTANIAGNKADIAKNTTDIAGNKTAITQNTTDITKNTSDIAGNTAAINQNTTDITGNKTAITQNTTNITKNTSDIAGNTAAITQNTTDIAGNKTVITQNTADIAGNKVDITKNTTDIAKNTGDITTINNNLAAGTLGLVQLSADGKKVVLSDKAKDTTEFEFGGKKLSGVSNAVLAADSTEAVNGSQLFATNEQVKANTDGITQHTADIAKNTTNIAGNKADITQHTADIAGNKADITQHTADIAGNKADITKNTTDIAGNKADITKNTTDIAGNKVDITKNTTDIAKNTGDITTINNNLAAGTLGLVQLSADGKKVVLSDKAKDATVFEFGGKKLSGVSNAALAADSTEAVNGSQLFATNKQVTDNTSAIAQNTTDITKNTNEISAISKNLDSGSLGLVQLNADGKRIVLSDKADGARVFDFNNRTLSGVSAGRVAADSSEAVNGSQLHATNQDVEKNTQSIKSNTDKLAVHESSITQNTNDIQANTNKLAEHDAAITKNTNDIKENTNRLNNHDKDIAQNKQDIKTNTETLNRHDVIISKNTSDIEKNTSTIEKQGGDIARLSSEMGNAGVVKISNDGKQVELSDKAKTATSFNIGNKRVSGVADAKNDNDAINYAQMKRSNETTLKSANTYTDKRISQLGEYTTNGLNRLNDRVDDLDNKVNKGFATNAALSGLFQPYGVGKMNLTAGVGGYKDESAVAVGVGYRFNDSVAVKGGVATSAGNGSSTMYNASVNFEW